MTYSSRVAQKEYFIVRNYITCLNFFFNFSVSDWDLDVRECYLDQKLYNMLAGIEDNTSLTDVSSRDKTTPSSRRRKKVVTFASMAELAEIQALAACETDSQCSESGKTPSLDETTLQAVQDPRLFLNMPLEDYDASCGNVSTAVPKYCSRLLIEFIHKALRQSDISFTISLCYLSQGLFQENSKKFACFYFSENLSETMSHGYIVQKNL